MTQDLADQELISVSYPDLRMRAIPAFSIDVPDDWVISEYPGALYAMGPVTDAPGPWCNVIVRHESVFAATTLEDIARSTWAEFAAVHPAATVTDQRLMRIGSTVHYSRVVQYTHHDGGELVEQNDTFTFGPAVGNNTVDLLHILWLTPAEHATAMTKVFIRMLASLSFEK